jgi:hypothetical protein
MSPIQDLIREVQRSQEVSRKRTARVGDSVDGPAVGLHVGDLVLQIRDRVASGDDVGLVVAVDVGHEQAPAIDNRGEKTDN